MAKKNTKPVTLITPEELAKLDMTADRSTWGVDDWLNYDAAVMDRQNQIALTATDEDALYDFQMAKSAQNKIDEPLRAAAEARHAASLENRKRGRPRKDRDDVSVRIDRELAQKALMIATFRGITTAEYLSERFKEAINEDATVVARKMMGHRE